MKSARSSSGAGGFGREVLSIVAAINGVLPTWDVLGVLDDYPSDTNSRAVEATGHDVIGLIADLTSLSGVAAVIGIGDPHVRARVDPGEPESRMGRPRTPRFDAGGLRDP